MDSTVIVAILSLAGTCLGTVGGILASSKLTNFRIQQLEEKVHEHNNYARRLPVLEEQMKVVNHRLEDLEGYHKPTN